jgi:hypothetical protein
MMRKSFRLNTKCVKYENANVLPEGTMEDALCASNFQKEKQGKIFEFKRPAFKSGIEKTKQSNPHFKNIRTGTGNYNIQRNNFIAPGIKGREVIDFEKLQLQDIETAGIKVQLGDKTLQQLFGIQVDDKTDKAWIDEYNRRKAAGESDAQINAMPPFGRPQRKVNKNVNFASQGLALDDKLELLKTAMSSNHIENQAELAKISTSVALILGDQRTLEALTTNNLNEIRNIANRLNIPLDYVSAGFTERIVSWEQYQLNMGVINLFLLRVAPQNRVNYPVKNEAGTKYIKITSILGTLKGKDGRYLDLLERQIISQDRAKELADAGIDNGTLNDIPASQVASTGWVASGKNPMTDFPQIKAPLGPGDVLPNIPVGPGSP